MSSETRKILLIGAKGYDRAKEGLRLDCVTWDKLSDILNVRDYDVLVINLLSIKSVAERKKVDWKKFDELLDFRATSDILVHEGEIFVLGDPRFEIPIPNEKIIKPFVDWTGATFVWDNQPGDTIKSNDLHLFKNYEKHLRTWNYSLAGCHLNRPVFNERWDLQEIENKRMFARIQMQAACYNRYEHALAFYIQHQARLPISSTAAIG
jgi:hypothetical protein